MCVCASGSGKSSVARQLQSQLGAHVVACDDYFIAHSNGIGSGDIDERAALARESPDSIDFARVEAELVALLERLQRDTDASTKRAPLIVVEGFLVLAAPPSLRRRFDANFLLYVDRDLCAERRVSRKQRSAAEQDAVRANYRRVVWPMFERHHSHVLTPLRERFAAASDELRNAPTDFQCRGLAALLTGEHTHRVSLSLAAADNRDDQSSLTISSLTTEIVTVIDGRSEHDNVRAIVDELKR